MMAPILAFKIMKFPDTPRTPDQHFNKLLDGIIHRAHVEDDCHFDISTNIQSFQTASMVLDLSIVVRHS